MKIYLNRALLIFFLGPLLILFGDVLHTSAQDRKPIGLELEADPLAYLLNGYSFHMGLTYGKFRSSVGVFGIEQPDFFLDNDAFSVYSSGFDVKTDYLFTGLKGFHGGLQLTYGRDQIALREDDEEEELWGLNIGLRTGYRFMLGKAESNYKGLYIHPWISLIYTPDAESVTKKGERYQQPTFSPFPAVHLGWRF